MAEKQKFITKTEEEEIIQAIQKAENDSSGEIRVHIEPHCEADDMRERAKFIFQKLNMHETALRNGVLIYLAVNDRKFYILGDEGIHKKVPDNFWESTKDIMQAHFKKGEFTQGLVEGIIRAGQQLKTHFPHQDDDINELSDEISRG